MPLRNPHAHRCRYPSRGQCHAIRCGHTDGGAAMNAPRVAVSRRGLLVGSGALVVSFSIARAPLAQEAATQGPRLPGSLRTAPMLDAWLRIDADGVTVFTGKAELGQGVKTALLQIAAEELDLEPREITLITADTERTPNEGYTSGSQSMTDSGVAIRHAAAQARALLIEAAAQRLDVGPEQLTVKNGAIVGPDGRSLRYVELASEGFLHVNAQPQTQLKDPSSYSVVGRDLPRVDIPAKV